MLLADALLGFVLLLIFAMVITVVMHIFLRVPYVPTSASIARQMVELADLRDGESVMDLGAGDGSILRVAKRSRPGIRAEGCEIVPTVWFFGFLRCIGSGVRLHLRSAFTEDVRGADVIFLFLMPELLQRLLPKFVAELKPGARIVCRTFPLPGYTPDRVVTVPWLGRDTKVFLYRWRATMPTTSA